MKTLKKCGVILLTLLCAVLFAMTAYADDAPVITADLPNSTVVAEGGEFTLSIAAEGEELVYQWYKNDEPLEGQTGPSYTETQVSAASNNARYYCYVQNSFGGAASQSCVLTVIQKPVLTKDLNITSLTLNPGDTITLSAQATGANLMIQWFCQTSETDYHVILNQSSSTLSIPASEEYNNTEIYCQFVNEAGSVNTSRCRILINNSTPSPSPTPAPTPVIPNITKHPVGETVDEGGRAIFIARAENVRTYSWRFVSPDNSRTLEYNNLGNSFPGLVVSGGTTDTITLNNIPYELNGWKVVCAFTNDGGTVVSGEAGIQVMKATSTLSIINQPRGGAMAIDEKPDFTLSIQATSSNGGTLTYQWYTAESNSAAAMQPITGATNSSYKPDREEGTRYYRVSVTLTSNGVTSEPIYSSIVPVTFTGAKVHVHQYSDVWEANDISHWHQCTCGDHTDEAFHTYVWTEIRKSTKDTDGEQKGVCSVCGHETIQPIPAGSQPEDSPEPTAAPARRASSNTPWMILLGVVAVGVITGAALLIRKVLLSNDEEDEDDTDDTDNE